MSFQPVGDPSKLTVLTVTAEVSTIGAAVQAELRASLVAGDDLREVFYLRNAQNPNRVTAYILFEDQ